jgi:hypothetical protein
MGNGGQAKNGQHGNKRNPESGSRQDVSGGGRSKSAAVHRTPLRLRPPILENGRLRAALAAQDAILDAVTYRIPIGENAHSTMPHLIKAALKF